MWGVGRHGPGNNVFSYFVEPNGFVTEYTTEVEQVDDTYVAHDAQWWTEHEAVPLPLEHGGRAVRVRPQGDVRRTGRGREPALRTGDGACARALDRRESALDAQGRAACVLSACWCLRRRSPRAQQYPTRTVEIIVPFAAGGGNDLLARMIGEGLGKRLGQSFVPLNRPGANTNNGTLQVVKSAPDGHTLLISSVGLAANPLLYKRLPFNTLTDLAPITLIASSPTILVVPTALPANTVAEFVAYLKARPGELNYASYGVGSSPHLATELFQSITGTEMRARAVFRRRSGRGRRHGQQRADAVLQRAAGARPDPGRPAQADRDRRRQALAAAAERADVRRRAVSTTTSAPGSGCWRRRRRRRASSQRCTGTRSIRCRSPRCARASLEQGAEVVANTPDEFRAFIKDEMDRSRPSSRTRTSSWIDPSHARPCAGHPRQHICDANAGDRNTEETCDRTERQEADRPHRGRPHPHDVDAEAAGRRGRALHRARRMHQPHLGRDGRTRHRRGRDRRHRCSSRRCPARWSVGPALTVRNIRRRVDPRVAAQREQERHGRVRGAQPRRGRRRAGDLRRVGRVQHGRHLRLHRRSARASAAPS